jgi:hypothetical protein
MSAFGGVKRTLIDPSSAYLLSALIGWAMGYNTTNDEIRDNVTRMRREWEAERE